MKQHLRFLFTLLLAIVCGGAMFGQTTVTDEITISGLGLTSSSYTSFSNKKLKSGAIYAGNMSASSSTGYIQIKSSKTSGICTTKSGGTVKSITITFNSGSKTSRKIAVFGSNTSYKAISDLYTSSTPGTQIGTDLAPTSSQNEFTLTPTEKYSDVGIKALSPDAIKIDKITIVWEVASSEPTSTVLSFGTDYDGQTITKNVGEKFTVAATLTPAVEGAEIKYVSNASNVASVNETTGEVTVNAVGTAKITASYAGNDTYAKSEKSYTINAIDASKTATSISFPKTSYTYQYGEDDGVAIIENVATILPADAGKLTYSITNPEGIEIASLDTDGTTVMVDTKKVGTATVTASFAGNDTYAASSASYTIEVKKAAVVEDGVFDFTQSENDYGSGVKASSGSSFVENSTWVAGSVTMTTSKGTGSGVRWWLNNDKTTELRVYKGSNLTISVGEGYFINSIELDGVRSGLKASNGTMNNGTWSGKSQSVTFTASNDRKDIKTITVKYTKLETLTTAASGFATYAAGYDVNYSALGLTTYAIALDEVNNKVSYNRFEGVVPAGKAVLVQGTASTPYALTPAEGAADATFTTDLKASDGTVTAADDKIYAFGTLNGKSGFKLVTNGIKIPAKKGYLQLTGTTAAKPTFFAFDGIGTGISHIEADTALENAAMYNLAGQRVDKSYKGVVIVNGKKMLRK